MKNGDNRQKNLKVKKIVDIKTSYSFEAPKLKASFSLRGNGKQLNPDLLDLNSTLVPNPRDYYLVRVAGESMINEGIYEGDILIVSKREKPTDGKIIIAALNGEMAVKTYRRVDGREYLYSANEKFTPIEIMSFFDFEIQGVVKHVIHDV